MVLTYNGMTKSLLLNQALLPPKGGQERIVVMSNPDPVPEKSLKSLAGFSFENGNALLMVAYHKGVESGMCDSPISGRDYAFQFSNNGPCSGLDSVFFQDQWYHTRQIMSQCWMKENLNAGIRIGALQNQTNNNILEKHCYQDLESNCETLGGLYTWDEMMQYTAEESAQGICPEGWHVPCDQDWRVLEGIVDSHYPILSIVWGNMNLRGLDAGANLKTTQGWSVNTGTDLYGFSAKPSGYWWQSDYFEYSNFCIFWTSTRDAVQVPIYRGLRMDTNRIFRMNVNSGTTGYSVRCLKNQ